MIEDIKGHPVPALQVFSNMISMLKKRVESEIPNFNKNSVNYNVQWVLTIPAAWTDRAETFMRTCAEKVSVYIQYLIRI